MKHKRNGVDAPADGLTVRRAGILAIMVTALFAVLLIRILVLQTVEYDRYQQKVIDQITTQTEVTANRGTIYDRNGVALATNITTYRIFVSPKSISDAQSEMDRNGEKIDLDDMIAEKLSGLLGVTKDFVLQETGKVRYLDRTIKRNVSEEVADSVRAFIKEKGLQRMIYLQPTSTRYYPRETLASHVLGFTGSDGTGLYGLEYSYNQLLAGTNGRIVTARDARGNEMPYEYEEYIEAKDGYDLTTTLDAYVQAALEQQLENAYTASGGKNRAAGIVMDVNTGAILGMAVYPYFNLNDPWTLDEQSEEKLSECECAPGTEEHEKYRQELLLRMWSNKALTESYIPGSTFKVITASMVLEEDVVKTTDSFNCPGYKEVLGHKIHCHKTTGHGALTFAQGIQQSCNPVLMSVGLKLGADKFYNYLTSFGYREKTGIDLPGEGTSVVAARDSFTDLDLAIYSFGQNFNVTLIQQITAISAVANGGYLVTPHLLSSVTDGEGNVIRSFDTNVRRQVVSAGVCKTVSQILEEGVSGNGGAKNAYVAGYRIAAKTGTSEKKDAGAKGKYVCSTVAYAPAENPRYAVIIIVDEPSKGLLYGSTVAAPYVANVMEVILPYLGVEAIYSEEELAHKVVEAPRVLGWTGTYAQKRYGEKFRIDIIGDEDGVIVGQYPEPGTAMEQETARLVLYTGKKASDVEPETVVVPDLTDMTALAAAGKLRELGLNVRIKGTKYYTSGSNATVISQSVEKGTVVPRGTVIEIRFYSLEDEDGGGL